MTSEEKLRSVNMFVEAKNYERFALWKEFHDKYNWVEDTSGFSIQIGEISSGKPVNVQFFFATINDVLVCFYEPISRYVDYIMVENYIKNNFKITMTDAMNFSPMRLLDIAKQRKIKLNTI
jgi:hypothetical protein